MVESLQQEISALRALLRSERDPEGRAFVPLADAYRRAGDLEAALDAVTEGLARHPTLASAHVVHGWICQDRGSMEEAIAAFQRVLELDQENVEGLRGLGRLYLETGRAEEARSFLAKARALDPDEVSGRDPGPAREGPRESIEAPTDAPSAEGDALVPATAGADPTADAPAATPPSQDPEEAVEGVDLVLSEGAEGGPPSEPAAARPDEGTMGTDAPFFEIEAPADVLPEGEAPEPAEVPREIEAAELADVLPEAEAVELTDVVAGAEAAELAGALPEAEPAEPSDERPAAGDGPVGPPAEPEPVTAAGVEVLLGSVDLDAPDSDPALEDAADPWKESEPPALPPTRTLAEVFARQGLVDRAIQIYDTLLEQAPGDEELAARLAELREAALVGEDGPEADGPDETEALALEMSRSTGAPGDLSTPFAWAEESRPGEGAGGEPIGRYFERLLAWEPGAETAPALAPAVTFDRDAPLGESPAGEGSEADALAPATDAEAAPATPKEPPRDRLLEPVWDEAWDAPRSEAADRTAALAADDDGGASPRLAPEGEDVDPPYADASAGQMDEGQGTEDGAGAPETVAEVHQGAALEGPSLLRVEEPAPPAAPTHGPTTAVPIETLAPVEEPPVEEPLPGEPRDEEPLDDGAAPVGSQPLDEEITEPAAWSGTAHEPVAVDSVEALTGPAEVASAPVGWPEETGEPLPVIPVEALAPDGVASATDAPGEPAEPLAVVPIDALAPASTEAASPSGDPTPDAVPIEALAPAAEESAEVVSMESLAPDEVEEAGGPAPVEDGVVEIAALAPGPIVPVAWLAPGPIVAVEALAPDPNPTR